LAGPALSVHGTTAAAPTATATSHARRRRLLSTLPPRNGETSVSSSHRSDYLRKCANQPIRPRESASLSQGGPTIGTMPLPLPTSLSPSKVASFKDCALAFRFSAIDHLPEPPSPSAAKGTLVHRALELLFWDEPPGARTIEAALEKLARAEREVLEDAEYVGLELTAEERAEFVADAEGLIRRYFVLEDPNTINPIGLELRLEAKVGTLNLRGIIDRLELDADGELVVTDYKTGKPPGQAYEKSRLGGV